MTPENRNPGAARTAAGAEVDRKADSGDITPIAGTLQRRAAARLAARFGLTASVALVVAGLAGLGRRF